MAVLHDVNSPQIRNSNTLPPGAGYDPDAEIDKLIKTKERMAKLAAVTGGGGGNGSETLAATIVSKALDINQKTNEQLQEQVRHKEIDVANAIKEADRTKEQLMTIIASQVSGAVNKMEERLEEIKKGASQVAPPKSWIEQLRELKELEAVLNPDRHSPPPSPGLQDLTATLQLQQIKNEHELAMKKFDVELQRMQTDLQLRLTEMSENSKWKNREYEDDRKFKSSALEQVGDIAAGIAAGLGSAKVAGGIAGQPEAADDTQYDQPQKGRHSAVIEAFKCQTCGGDIKVPDEGDQVTCPNMECGTTYALTKKEG
jgi:hypothetical protein